MKYLCLFLVAAFSAATLAETVVKSSAPFAFPIVAGVQKDRSPQDQTASFTVKSRHPGSIGLAFSWSVPATQMKTGAIAIYTLSGALVKTIFLRSSSGSIDVGKTVRPAPGIYFAKLSFGAFEKNLTIIIN